MLWFVSFVRSPGMVHAGQGLGCLAHMLAQVYMLYMHVEWYLAHVLVLAYL